MAERFVVVDRNTPMLLAPDLSEWVTFTAQSLGGVSFLQRAPANLILGRRLNPRLYPHRH